MKSMQIAIFSLNSKTAAGQPTLEASNRLFRSLVRIGHRVTYYQPEPAGPRTLRESRDSDGVRNVFYSTRGYVGLFECLEEAGRADAILKVSGCGPFDHLLETAVLEVRKPEGLVVLADLEANATLDRLRRDASGPLARLIADYDLVLIADGGPAVVDAYLALGARECVRLGSALDSATRRVAPPDPQQPFHGLKVSLPHVMALEHVLGQRLSSRQGRMQAPAVAAGVR